MEEQVKETKETQKSEENKKESKSGKTTSAKEEKNSAKEELKAKDEEIASLKEQLSEEKNSYLRLMAEFETFRRRSAQDRLELVKNASADTIKGLLPVLDDCERALAMLEDSADEAAKSGTALIYNKLLTYLKTRGLEPIKAQGEKFDTEFHEAVAQLPAPDESQKGMVSAVAETGYMFCGKILRYSKVVVLI